MSISGSGSLHSWNLETTEELSDLTEDSDWLNTSLPKEDGTDGQNATYEMDEQEKQPRENTEKQESSKVAINGNQEEEEEEKHIRNSMREVKLEEEKKKEQKINLVLGEDHLKDMNEGREDKKLKEKSGNEQSECEEEAAGQEEGGRINEMQDSVTGEDGKDIQEEESQAAETPLNKCIKLNPQPPDSEEEQQGQLETAVSPRPQSPAIDPKCTAPTEENGAKAEEKKETEIQQAFSPPRVLSAVARFQPKPKPLTEPVFLRKENAQIHSTCDSDTSSSEAAEEQDRPLVKVAELKKRFEA